MCSIVPPRRDPPGELKPTTVPRLRPRTEIERRLFRKEATETRLFGAADEDNFIFDGVSGGCSSKTALSMVGYCTVCDWTSRSWILRWSLTERMSLASLLSESRAEKSLGNGYLLKNSLGLYSFATTLVLLVLSVVVYKPLETSGSWNGGQNIIEQKKQRPCTISEI